MSVSLKLYGLWFSFEEELWAKFLCLLLKRLINCKMMKWCVCKKGIFTSSSHRVVNSEAFFFPEDLVENILFSVLRMEIFGGGIGLEKAML